MIFLVLDERYDAGRRALVLDHIAGQAVQTIVKASNTSIYTTTNHQCLVLVVVVVVAALVAVIYSNNDDGDDITLRTFLPNRTVCGLPGSKHVPM